MVPEWGLVLNPVLLFYHLLKIEDNYVVQVEEVQSPLVATQWIGLHK